MAYVKKEPIVEFITKGLNNPDKTKAFGHDAIEILTEIEYAPTADVVDVVSCKDCLHEKVCVWNAELEEACNEDCSDFKNKADYAEVKHGEWIPEVLLTGTLYLTGTGHDNELQWFKCSLCGRKSLVKEPYCHCGAKMDGGKGDE